METAATKIARLDRSIARAGETITLQRTSVDGAGAVTVSLELADCPAHVRASAPQDIDAGPDVRESRVILSPTHLLAETGSPPEAFGIPQKDDRLLIQGDPSNVESVAPIYYGGALVRVNLLCRG